MDPLRYALGLAIMAATLVVMAFAALFVFAPARRRNGSTPDMED